MVLYGHELGRSHPWSLRLDLLDYRGPRPIVAMARHGHGGQGPPQLRPSIALAMGHRPVEVFLGFFVINQMTL